VSARTKLVNAKAALSRRKGGMKKFIIPVVMTLVLSTVLIYLFQTIPLMPAQGSAEGQVVDGLTRFLFSLGSFFFSLVFSFIVYSVIVFRRRPRDTADARPIHGNVTLEVIWTLVPLFIVLGLAGYSTKLIIELDQPDAPQELLVEVTGQQWAWAFYYPDYGFTSSELVLPLDQPVLFHVYSTDVIHSFWVPEFRIKVDAIPGIENHVRLTPSELGSYRVVCAELCGTAHSYMAAAVRVVTPAEFATWALQQQEASGCVGPIADQRTQLAADMGCLGCHSIDRHHDLTGPTFRGLYGSRRTLEDGSVVVADEEYLRNSILLPGAQVVKGYPNVMPKDYRERLSAEQLQTLVDYLKSLK
jgi:cytochrome c oxidase subunit 2